MFATLVIGLREGLEAALIVGIIAAFLRKNGKSLVPMWIGVVLAIVLSIAVGVGLHLIEQELPQARQEAMESIIGVVAICFVTGMIVWMNTHSRGMKQELELEAAEALGEGGARSLAVMAFLAVLKEGFETSVFLLATFSAAQSASLAAFGAVLGVVIAAAIGWGIYAGSVKMNLSRFFRITGAFLILVAGGLVITVLRTAHEAGWLNAGQQATVDLSWLVRPGSIQAALITGVLGIPADPRLIEVLGWFAYVIPVSLYVYWPAHLRPKGGAAARVQFAAAAGLVLVALGLAAAYPKPAPLPSSPVSLVASADDDQQPMGTALLRTNPGSAAEVAISYADGATASIPLDPAAAKPDLHNNVNAAARVVNRVESATDGAPETMTVDQLAELAGGRLPIGINAQQNPGPFDVERSTVTNDTVWTARGALLDANQTAKTIAKISGGGLMSPRTITVPNSGSHNWIVSPADVARNAAAINGLVMAESERAFWARELPVGLAAGALVFAVAGVRTLRREQRPPGDPAGLPGAARTRAPAASR